MSIKFGFVAKEIIEEGRVKEENITSLKTWLDVQNLPRLTEEQIVLFLLSCDNVEDATKNTIKAYYKVRNSVPEIFKDRNPSREDLQKNLNGAQLVVLPVRTNDGCAIIVSRLVDGNYKNAVLQAYFTNICMAIDVVLYDNPPSGLIIIIDVPLVTLKHITCLRIGLMKSICHYFQEGLPIKLNHIYVLNCSYVMDKMIQLIRPMMRKDVLDKIQCYTSNSNMDEFYENCLPKCCLPLEYGGDLPSMEELQQLYIKKVNDMQLFFEAEEKQRESFKF